MFLLLADNLTNAIAAHPVLDIGEQGARSAGEVQYTVQMLLFACGRVLTIQGHNTGQDAGDLLRGIELSGLFPRARGKLADEVFIGIAQAISIGGGFCQPFGNLGDDGTEPGIAI